MENQLKHSGPHQYQSACIALENTNWSLAKELLADLLTLNELPELLEKYAWATWWLGQANETFNARERAYTLYRKLNDCQSAARIALWIASDYLDFKGDPIMANGWRKRAIRLLQGQTLMPEHGWLALQNGAMAIELEQEPLTAIKYARKAARIGRKLKHSDLEVIAMAMEGLALASQGNITSGMLLLDEAGIAVSTGEVQELYSVTWTYCYIIYACERIRDLERVEQWCKKMKELSQKINFRFTLGICRAHYAGALIWQGKWLDAETELQASLLDLENSRHPYLIESLARLGELRRRQGKFAEANKLFEQAEFHPIAILGRAELMVERKANYQEADELLEHYLRNIPPTNKLQLFPILELQAKIFAKSGKLTQAENVFTTLESIAKDIHTLPILGAYYFAGGLIAFSRKNYEKARQLFQDSIYSYSKSNMLFEASIVRIELSGTWLKLGRISRAQKDAQKAFDLFTQIGALHGRKVALKLLNALGKGVKREKFYLNSGEELTKREVEVLRLVAEGKTDKQIADLLFRSEHTVHRHMSNILLKLNVSSRSAAVAMLSKNKGL
jgi:LuxR family maltose regulon positive regulatory protein